MNEESNQENASKDDTQTVYDTRISGTEGQAESTSAAAIIARADDDRDQSKISHSAAENATAFAI